MATITQKIQAETQIRDLLKDYDLPQPDSVEYGYDCIRLFYNEPKVVLVIDFEGETDGLRAAGEDDVPAHGNADTN